MKSSSPALRSLLASRQWYSADLYTFSGGLLGANVFRYTSGDRDIISGGNIYSSAIGFDRSPSSKAATTGALTGTKTTGHWKIGVTVDTFIFDMLPKPADTILGISWFQAVIQGWLDGAQVEVDRAIMPTYGDVSAGVVNIFTGYADEITSDGQVITPTITSPLIILNKQMPHNLYQAGCLWNLFDAGCTLSAAAFRVSSSALSGSTSSTINATLSQVSGYFALGKVVATSGVNNGLSRTVKAYTQGSPSLVTLIAPFPNAFQAGDTFDIFPGCDKTQPTCTNKFNNLANFRGFPDVPAPESAV